MGGKKERVGTIHYMAPEQLQSQPCFASDQYALGIVTYEWLCGDVPFQGSTLAITAQHLFNEPPSIHEKVPTIPVAVEQVIMQALAKDPTQRFPNVQTFALALEQAYKQSLAVQDQPAAPQLTYASQSRGIKPIVLRQRQLIAPQPASTPQSRGIKPILLVSKPKKSVVKRGNIWRKIATIFATDMAVGSVVGIILLILGLNIQTIWFLISLCLVSMPILAAYATKNRPVFVISTSILAVASVLGIGFHSPVLFATVYGSLIFFSLLITFSGSLQRFKRR
jgi:serine/threonine protein kinase